VDCRTKIFMFVSLIYVFIVLLIDFFRLLELWTCIKRWW